MYCWLCHCASNGVHSPGFMLNATTVLSYVVSKAPVAPFLSPVYELVSSISYLAALVAVKKCLRKSFYACPADCWCSALLPFPLHVLTAGMSAFSLSSCVEYALGVSLISVWRGTSIHGLCSCGTFIKYAYMHLKMAWCVTIKMFSLRSSSMMIGSRRITTSRYDSPPR